MVNITFSLFLSENINSQPKLKSIDCKYFSGRIYTTEGSETNVHDELRTTVRAA